MDSLSLRGKKKMIAPRLHRSRTYYRYLLSYTVLLLAVLTVFAVFFHVYFVRNLRDNLLEMQKSALTQTAERLDSQFNQINAIDYQVSSFDENFLSIYLDESTPLRDMRIVREFKNLVAPSTFIAEMALVNPDDPNVYTASAVYSRPVFFQRIFRFEEGFDPDTFFSAFQERAARVAVQPSSGERYLALIHPPSVFSRLSGMYQFFFIRESSLTALLAPEGTFRQGAILDAQGGVLLCTLPEVNEQAFTGNQLWAAGADYLILRQDSSVMGWQYLSLLPVQKTMAPIYQAYNVLLVMLLVLFGMGLLIIRYCMSLTYTPIKNLTQVLGLSPQEDDVESLRDAIQDLSARNEAMHSRLLGGPDGQPLKDALLFSLLKGKFSSFADFNQEGAALGMRFDKAWYQVLMLRVFDDNAEKVTRDALAEMLADTLGAAGYRYYFRELFEPSMTVCLVGMDACPGPADEEAYRRMLQWGQQAHGFSFSVGVSNGYRDISRISVACYEATQAVKEYFVRGRQQLISYQEVNRSLPRPRDFLPMLDNLKAETPAQRMQTASQFVQLIKEQRLPSLLAKSYCNFAVQQLLDASPGNIQIDDLFSLSYLKTVDDYLAFVLHMLKSGMDASDEPQQPRPGSELLERIYAFLSENYDDCNFSVQDTAERLGLSGSYLSQYFKQQTGDTLSNYVSSLRVKKARALLENTAMPLQMVAESVGYYSLNSFIRRFKQVTGVTPGEYRRGC